MSNDELNLNSDRSIESVEKYEFDLPPIKGFPELRWAGKRPFRSTHYYPAQLKENHGEPVDGWMNEIYWGDNLQVMSHLLKKYRGQVKLIYIDPPFDSKAEYKKKIQLKGKTVTNDQNAFEEKQYNDIWTNDEYLQFMYERLILIRELLADDGCIYLHCDYRKHHQLRQLLDEVFGPDNFLNSLVWMFTTRSSIKSSWKRTHHDLLFYKKQKPPVFNWSDEMVLEDLSESTIKKYKYEDEIGKYRLNGRNIVGSSIKSAKDVDPEWEKTHPELVVRDYLRSGKVPSDYFFVDIENQAASTRTDYPTQKPEELLMKLIRASTRPGDLVFDSFMGSGTAQAVAMKLGRRFIGADINLGAIQTTTKRLINIAQELKDDGEKRKTDDALFAAEEEPAYGAVDKFYTGFSVYNVNNYDIFRNPVQAKDLLMEALEVQKLPGNIVFDGMLDDRLIKILPVDHIATRADLNELISNLDYKAYEKRQSESPGKPVEKITFYCLGHEPDLAAVLQEQVPFKLDIQVVDILRDRQDLQFKRDSEADIIADKGVLKITQFYPLNLLQKLSLMKENVTEWREMVESVMIDFNYDGAVFEPQTVDVPEKNELVKGEYEIPADASEIRVKITDLLSESLEVTVR